MLNQFRSLFWTHSHYENKCWRWWLSLEGKPLNLVALEVSWQYPHWSAEISLGDEETQLGFTLTGFGVLLYAGFNYLPIPRILTHYFRESTHCSPPRMIEYPRRLDFGVSLIKGEHPILEPSIILLKLFSKNSFGGFDEYWSGPEIHLNPVGWIFGKETYQSEVLEEQDTELVFPEGSYPVRIEIRRDRWSRTRYWGELIVHRCDMHILDEEQPIPTGGFKFGSPNDTFGICIPLADDGSLPENPIEAAKQKMIESINRDRKENGFQTHA